MEVTKKMVRETIAALPHVKCRYDRNFREWRIAYVGLKPEREEAMAAYVSSDHVDDSGEEEAIATARQMERDYELTVFHCDKLPATLAKELNNA